MSPKNLTDAQRKAIDEASAQVQKVVAEARRSLASVGLTPGDGPTQCLVCGCDRLEVDPSTGRCRNCDHGPFVHNLPI